MKTNIFFILFALGSFYAQAQNLDWVNSINSDLIAVPSAIALDNRNNLITIGSFQGNCDFDSGPNTFSVTSQNVTNWNGFIQKVDSTGKFVWAKTLRAYNSSSVKDVTTDKDGNIFIVGNFNGPLEIEL